MTGLVWLLFMTSGVVIAQDDSLMFGADEIAASEARSSPCDGTYQWMCADGGCIAQYDVCDGIAQCEDGSDELNCDHPRGNLKQQQVQPSRHVQLQPKATNVSTTPLPVTVTSNSLSLKLAAMGAFGFVALAALVHYVCKRRKANRRNVRKGESLLEDEDDLLISQMYA